ncbi:hypothetical protein GCK32_002105 [Trichostrongylus colubriformis]|uniref:Uncharacterized protein n=1 Tax=Trichostrongylus colubriformis TaxID=6319 RepID=A0AAN8IN07_TRICO
MSVRKLRSDGQDVTSRFYHEAANSCPHVAVEQILTSSDDSTPLRARNETPGPRSHLRVNFRGKLHRDVAESSKHGGAECYTFEFLRRTMQGQVVYRRLGCKKKGRTASVAVMDGYNLVDNPTDLTHVRLCALVTDSVHDLQPDATNKTEQLYVIHGVLANSVDVPLVFAITTRNNPRVYEIIYGTIGNIIAASVGPRLLQLLLDSEKAAINVARKKNKSDRALLPPPSFIKRRVVRQEHEKT